jgi:hypothetical protein
MKSIQILKHLEIAKQKVDFYEKYIGIQKKLIDKLNNPSEYVFGLSVQVPETIDDLKRQLEAMDLEKKVSATQQYIDMYTAQLEKFRKEFYELGVQAEKEFMPVYNSKKSLIKNKLPEISRLVETGEFDKLKVNVKIELFEKIQEL